MRDPMRDAVAKAGAKVARCKMNMMLAMRELENAQAAVMNAPVPVKGVWKYTIKLTGFGQNRIAVIKTVREFTNLGLKEAKELTDIASAINPPTVLQNLTAEDLAHVKAKFDAAGATLKIVKHN